MRTFHALVPFFHMTTPSSSQLRGSINQQVTAMNSCHRQENYKRKSHQTATLTLHTEVITKLIKRNIKYEEFNTEWEGRVAQLVWLKNKGCVSEPKALCCIALSSFANNSELESKYKG